MTTSCCPSYVQLAEKHIPDLKKYISSTGSPMYYTARIVKEKYPDAKIVFVGPCVAKRKEVKLDPCVDFTLTFEEVGSVLRDWVSRSRRPSLSPYYLTLSVRRMASPKVVV